jgi:class 3 adenylate cyclase
VFPRATQAVAAAVQVQRTLATEPWPLGGVVRVRIGMHTGEPIRTPDGYTGLDVIRAARIREAGHGGQVLLSASTAAIVQDVLFDGLSLRDLGAHRLKGFLRPERIFQRLIPDLPDTFPPLQSLDARAGPQSGSEAARVLTTVLFTEIVGATQQAVALGDRRWRARLAQHKALVRGELARYGGHEVNVVADGCFATVDSPASGIRCACAIREAVKALGLDVRVGVHAGEVEPEGEEVTGITVHTGCYVRRRAGPGEVLVSRAVKELVAGSGIAFTDRGTHTLNGLPGEWPLFAPDVREASGPT